MIHDLCGLKVVSEIPLPDLLPWAGGDGPADIEIRLGHVPDALEHAVHVGPLLQTDRHGTCRYVIAGVATYLVEAGRRVTVCPVLAPDTPDVRLFLLGSVFGFLCHQRGLLPLHASCLEIGGRAVAFAGQSGAGKSTLAAACLRRGFRLLADDVTVVDVSHPAGPMVLPAFPRIKLWRDAIDGLGLPRDGLERIRPTLEKFRMPVENHFRAVPLPLAAVYHLRTVNDARHAGFEPLRGAAAMNALVDAVYRRFSAFRMGRRGAVMSALIRIAALPAMQVSRVMDLGALDETVTAIADHRAGIDGVPS